LTASLVSRFAGAAVVAVAASAAIAAQSSSIPGLDVKVTKIEHAASASLKDCPPGTNTVNAVAKPGEQFELVTVAMKVAPDYKSGALNGKRPTAEDTAGKKYFTPSYLVDFGSATDFSCTFPFRVAEGTKLKTLKIENATVDLASIDK
jgi:hypothetical protein